jgi:ribonuclease HII
MADDSLEKNSWVASRLLLACDESGYGCISGSMYVAGTIFPADYDFSRLRGLNDSKKLSEKKRFELEGLIIADALYYFIARASAPEIDQGSAYHMRFSMAENEISKTLKLDMNSIDVIMDGNVKLKLNAASSTCLIKGDSKCLSISAASVLAKCAKDREMILIDKEFPMYGWASNKGYESEGHREAILKHGLTHFHRKSYCKKYLGESCI